MDLIERFANALDYPESHPGAILDDCLRELPPGEAAVRLRSFLDFTATLTGAEMQERYTRTFDFNAESCLYAGHHLVGDDDRRVAFLIRLKEHYRKASFDAGHELPDHIPVMLRYVAANAGDAEAQELVAECIVPALRALTRQLETGRQSAANIGARDCPLPTAHCQLPAADWSDLTAAIVLALEELGVAGREK